MVRDRYFSFDLVEFMDMHISIYASTSRWNPKSKICCIIRRNWANSYSANIFVYVETSGLIGRPSKDSINKILFQSLFFCSLIWLMLPLPRNLLLAPFVNVDLAFQGTKNGFVEIIWLRNGLGDIPYRSLEISIAGEITPNQSGSSLTRKAKVNFPGEGEPGSRSVSC